MKINEGEQKMKVAARSEESIDKGADV